MGFQIQDGTGTNNKVKVSISNKLFTESIIRTEREEEALLGEAYIIGTGFVTLTSDTQSSVLYFKNNEDLDLILTKFIIGVRDSTNGGENHIRGVIIKNPTSMSSGSGNNLVINNINFGSSNTINSDSEIGQEGASLNGGVTYFATVIPVEQLTSEDSATILPKGSSIGVNIIPPSGNTSLQVSVGLNLHKLTEELL
jgi:hypothetical protein